jgi:hypothetical protein
VTHTMSATSTLRVHPTRSVRRTSGLVLVGKPETINLLRKNHCSSLWIIFWFKKYERLACTYPRRGGPSSFIPWASYRCGSLSLAPGLLVSSK